MYDPSSVTSVGTNSATTPTSPSSSNLTLGFTLIGTRDDTPYIGEMDDMGSRENGNTPASQRDRDAPSHDVATMRARTPKRVSIEELLAEQRTPRFQLYREFVHLWLLARYAWSRGVRPWLGVATALACVLVTVFLHLHILRPELWRSGDVYAALPLTSELARLPMSLFFPAPYLPLWAACAQLVVVIGLGEMILGRWLTMTVALVAHFGSTLIARSLPLSVHAHVFGFTPGLARMLDAGPSAATTAVGACLLIAAHMHRTAVLLCLGLLIAAFVAPGLDAVEHTTALVCGLLAGFLYVMITSRSHEVSSASLWRMRAAGIARAFRSPRSALSGMRDRND